MKLNKAQMDIDDFIENHTHINYCEAIIHPDGSIEYARPSHVETLIRITGEDREVIYKKMPITASPIFWLIDYTRYISVWYDGYVKPDTCTKEQEESIKKLIDNNIIINNEF